MISCDYIEHNKGYFKIISYKYHDQVAERLSRCKLPKIISEVRKEQAYNRIYVERENICQMGKAEIGNLCT